MSPARGAPAVAAAAGGGKFSKWLATHKPEAGLGAAGIVVTLYLAYRQHQNAANNPNATNAAANSTPLPVTAYTGSPGGSGGAGFANELGPILAQLTAELGKAGQTAPTSATPTPASFAGLSIGSGPSGPESGYGAPQGTPFGQPFGASSGTYSQIPNQQVLAALESAGTPVYFEPTPGSFAQDQNPGALTPYTPVFVKQ